MQADSFVSEWPCLSEADFAVADSAELAVGVFEVASLLPLRSARIAPTLLIDALSSWRGHEKDRLILVKGELARSNLELPAAFHDGAHARAI